MKLMKRIRWQIKLLIAVALTIIGINAQMDMKYHDGMAQAAYQEAMR